MALSVLVILTLSYPGQVLYLYVRGDAGIAVFSAVLHIAEMENAGDYVQQLLRRDGGNRSEKKGEEQRVVA